jgi:hypothetical protein
VNLHGAVLIAAEIELERQKNLSHFPRQLGVALRQELKRLWRVIIKT